LFVNPAIYNYQLQTTSPCINTGTPSIAGLNLPATDFAGLPRVAGGRIDMGAFEHQGLIPVATIISGNPLNFGNYVLGNPKLVQNIVISNTGNADLIIQQISLQSAGTIFTWQFSGLNTPIAPGVAVTIAVSFQPVTAGVCNNTIIIQNNSANLPTISIPMNGTAYNTVPSTPQNLACVVSGNDAVVTWSPVTTYENGLPLTPAGYVVLYSENPDIADQQFYFLALT
jgi:hypothetical protein